MKTQRIVADPPPAGRQRGSALLVVILLTLVVTALGTSMLLTSNTEHLIAANERDSERSLFASKAGLEYGYYLFRQGMITPTTSGASFDSLATAVKTPLEGGGFTGKVYDLSATMARGQLYRIESTGTFNRSTRTTEVVVEMVPEAFKFGYMAFNAATLHNHSGLAGPSFKIESTVFSNGDVDVPDDITIDGSIVGSGNVQVNSGATVTGDVFCNSLSNSGTIKGDVKRVCSVDELPASAVTYDRIDNLGTKYNWYLSRSTPGSGSGGTIQGTNTAYTIQNGDEFKWTIFRRDGRLLSDPELNVIKYVPPPQLDYKAMKAEADKYDATYFPSMAAAMQYLGTKKVTETIGGKTVTTIKVGTTTFPEFLYVVGGFNLELKPSLGADNYGSGLLKADGFHLEGGIYATGDVEFMGPPYDSAIHPAPPDWYQFKINALPYCYPAIIAYNQPASGTIATWLPSNTPAVGTGAGFKMSSGSPWAGFTLINGVTYSQNETHLHHVSSDKELIRFIGAELAYKVHNCDYLWFTYDPAVRCTAFLVTDGGTPEVVSYREVR